MFLRNPVSRVEFFSQHVSEGKSPYLKGHFLSSSFDLGVFLKSRNEELSNLQTKMLNKRASCISESLIRQMSTWEARDAVLETFFI